MHVYDWSAPSAPKAVVQIAHGLAEHAGRYARLAAALNAAGYAVYANDHRGHGQTTPASDDLGFFAAREGWRKCVDDLWLLNRRIAVDHPSLPIILLGHSMGSFMAQQFAIEHGAALAGLVLVGSDGKPNLLAQIGRLIARLERWRLGPRGRSALIQSLSFGGFNKPFVPARTPSDWISRDTTEVDAYMADPLCGFRPTVQLWIDLLDALGGVAQPARQMHIPKRLPIYLISGMRDSVSANARGVKQLLSAYRAVGLERVTSHFYPEARHSLFHEINRDEVTNDLIAWLDGVISETGSKT